MDSKLSPTSSPEKSKEDLSSLKWNISNCKSLQSTYLDVKYLFEEQINNGILLGYSSESKEYKILDEETYSHVILHSY